MAEGVNVTKLNAIRLLEKSKLELLGGWLHVLASNNELINNSDSILYVSKMIRIATEIKNFYLTTHWVSERAKEVLDKVGSCSDFYEVKAGSRNFRKEGLHDLITHEHVVPVKTLSKYIVDSGRGLKRDVFINIMAKYCQRALITPGENFVLPQIDIPRDANNRAFSPPNSDPLARYHNSGIVLVEVKSLPSWYKPRL